MTSTVSGTTNCDLGELDYSISIRRLSFDKRTDRTYLLKTGSATRYSTWLLESRSSKPSSFRISSMIDSGCFSSKSSVQSYVPLI